MNLCRCQLFNTYKITTNINFIHSNHSFLIVFSVYTHYKTPKPYVIIIMCTTNRHTILTRKSRKLCGVALNRKSLGVRTAYKLLIYDSYGYRSTTLSHSYKKSDWKLSALPARIYRHSHDGNFVKLWYSLISILNTAFRQRLESRYTKLSSG